MALREEYVPPVLHSRRTAAGISLDVSPAAQSFIDAGQGMDDIVERILNAVHRAIPDVDVRIAYDRDPETEAESLIVRAGMEEPTSEGRLAMARTTRSFRETKKPGDANVVFAVERR